MSELLREIAASVADKMEPDANYVGEVLRAWAFREPYGCYSCFDLIDGFTEHPITTTIVERMMGRPFDGSTNCMGCSDNEVIEAGTYARHMNGVEVAWFWDGDGTLWFRVPNGPEVIHHDCKNNYEWEFVTLPVP